MKRLFIFSAFVVFNMLMASCTEDGSLVDGGGITNGVQADDDGGPGHLPINPPPTPPPPGNGIHP